MLTLRRLPGIIIITFLCVIVANAQSQEPVPSRGVKSNPPQKHTTESQQATTNDQRGTEQSPLVVKTINPPKSETEAEQERKQHDEKSSQDRWLVIFTGILAITTILLVIAGFCQVGIARSAIKRQLRAYLSVRPDNLPTLSATAPVLIRATLMNHGQTPAYNVTTTGMVEILPYPLPDNYQFPTSPVVPDSTYALHPTATFYTFFPAPRLFSVDEISRIITNDRCRIYVFGFSKYQDAFGRNHQTKFCSSIIGSNNLGIVSRGPTKEPVDIDFEPNPQHNEAD